LSQRRGLGLHSRLTLGVEDGLLLLLLHAACPGKRLNAGQLACLSLLPKAAQEAAVAGLCAKTLRTLLAVNAAKSLLCARKLSGRAERSLAGLHASLLPELPQAREGLAKLGASAVKLACLLSEHSAQLLLSSEALLGSLAHLLGQALLSCKLLPGG